MSEFTVEQNLIAELSPQPSLRMAAIATHMAALVAETERWCWKAISRGVGHRVWRSEAIYEEWPSTVVRYQFQILAPGEPPPGTGTIYGPWSR